MAARKRLPPRGSGYQPSPSNRIRRPKPPPGPAGVSPARPATVVIHVEQVAMPEVDAMIMSDPCRVFGHRAAYLAAGGVACGICGLPL